MTLSAVLVKRKLVAMSTPVRPEETIDTETKRVLAERDRAFEKEEKNARPWRDVKAEILPIRPPKP